MKNDMGDPMDRILLKREEILASAGFAASVMEAVRREAETPQPIPFPWKRALPVLVLAAPVLVLVLVAGIAAVWELSRTPGTAHAAALSTSGAWTWLVSFFPHGIGGAIGWAVLSLLTAFVSVRISLRLAGAGT